MTAEEKMVKRVEDLEADLFLQTSRAEIWAETAHKTAKSLNSQIAANKRQQTIVDRQAAQLTARDEVIKALVEVVKIARRGWAAESHPDYIPEVRRRAINLTDKATAALALAADLEEG